jgi:hypothetical protein
MMRFESPSDLPGQERIAPRRDPARTALAVAAGAMWPPLILTFPFWPPKNWLPGLEMDWRLAVLLLGLISTPAGMWLLDRERRRTGRPATRLGVVWRFMFYGGLLAAALGAVVALGLSVTQWLSAASPGEAAGGTETTLLIFGVGGMPVAVLVGVSYALWAGLCAAFIAWRPQPEVRDRLGVMSRSGRD